MIVTVGPRGQIAIPKVLRVELGIEPGDKITITRIKDGISLKPVTLSIFDLKGSIPVQEDGSYSLAQIREQVGDYIAKKAKGETAE